MIRAALYTPGEGLRTGGEGLVAAWLQSSDSVIWVDLEGEPGDRERAMLKEFDIHPLAIQDALRKRHPPKVEEFENFLFVLLRGLDPTTTTIDFGVIQLAMFISDRFIVTRHDQPSTSANAVWEDLQQEDMQSGPGSLALEIANKLQRRYIEILLALEPRLDEIEAEMFARPNDKQLAELTSYKSKLRQLARIATYHETVVAGLRGGDQSYVPKSFVHELNDISEQTERAKSLAELYFNMAADLIESYLALSSHRLNGVMQILTIITVIFVPLTFIAGIYGMNFENIPELRSNIGYFVVIGVMLVIAAIQLVLFRRKGWM